MTIEEKLQLLGIQEVTQTDNRKMVQEYLDYQ